MDCAAASSSAGVRSVSAWAHGGDARDPLRDLLSARFDSLAVRAEGAGDRLQELREAGPAPPVLGRVVGAPEERLELRREKDAHRPPARARDHLDRAHVDPVEVGSLLAIDLDVDEEVVHQLGDFRVLERLVLHHVTPVTGRVADREEDRPILPRARSSASSPHAYQSTGLCACWRRYGLDSWISRFGWRSGGVIGPPWMAGTPTPPVQRMRIERTYFELSAAVRLAVRGAERAMLSRSATSSRKETEKRAWHGLMRICIFPPSSFTKGRSAT